MIAVAQHSQLDLANIFANRCRWGDFTQTAQGTRIFGFLYAASQLCQPHDIVLDISAGQRRYEPFFEHAQYVAIDSGVGDEDWNYSQLDLVGNALCLPIKTESVDIALNFVSLEHYAEPNRFFGEVYRILKPGGKLFLYAPFFHDEHQIPHDYFRYTRYGLAHLCAKSGLEVDKIIPTNGIFESAGDLLKQAISLIGDEGLRNRLFSLYEKEFAGVLRRFEATTSDLTAIEWPKVPGVPQFPSNYCLVAGKPGLLTRSNRFEGRYGLIKSIAACPHCKSSLEWGENMIQCKPCRRVFGRQGQVPDLMMNS